MKSRIRIVSGPQAGESVEVPEAGIFIGRRRDKLEKLAENPAEFGLPVRSGAVILDYEDPEKKLSGRHAWVGYDMQGELVVRDLGSTNHTYVGDSDEPVEMARLRHGDRVRLSRAGAVEFTVEVEVECYRTVRDEQARPTPVPGAPVVQLKGDALNIGRDKDNDIVLDYPQISRHHSRIFRRGGEVFVADLGSTNGTSVNGRRITEQRLCIGDTVGLGSYLLRYGTDGRISQESLAGRVRFEAHDITKAVKDKVIIRNISFVSYPREFVGLIGPAGCGKTTLLNVITGYDNRATGRVVFSGMDLYENYDALRGNIGYVPQDDIVHRALTVYQSLYYTAKLRMPEDTSEEEIVARVNQVIRELGLEGCRDVLIGGPEKKGISGGQRKRVNMAQELITEPTCLFLDEPTSGLDGALEIEVMELLKGIAEKGKNIVICTHNIRPHNFETITNVLIIFQGRLVYYGPGREVFDYFGFGRDLPEKIFFHLNGKYCPKCDRIYTNVPQPVKSCETCHEECYHPPKYWEQRFRESSYYGKYVAGRMNVQSVQTSVGARPSRQQSNSLRQWWILTRRYWRIKLADTAATAVLLLQAPIIALLLGLVFGGKGYPQMGGVLFMMAIASIWFGATNACREIVAERTVYRRERMVNLKIGPYILSKAVVLSGFLVLQCLILALFAKLMVRELPGSVLGYTGILALGGMAGSAMGLLISALLTSAEGAMGLVPVTLIPQVLFAGTIIKLEELGGMRFLADFMPSRWVLDALSHLSDRTNVAVAQHLVQQGLVDGNATFYWFAGMPSVGLGLDVLVLVLLTVAFTALAGAALKAKDMV